MIARTGPNILTDPEEYFGPVFVVPVRDPDFLGPIRGPDCSIRYDHPVGFEHRIGFGYGSEILQKLN